MPTTRLKRYILSLWSCWLLTASGAVHAQEIAGTFLGPETIETVRLDAPEVLFRIGDPDGPGMLEQGRAVIMAPGPDDGLLVFTSYASDGPIQLFREGKIVRTFGRRGGGPGEYIGISGLAFDPQTERIWANDNGSLVSFSLDGSPGPVLPTYYAGPGASQSLFLRDGSLLMVGPGGTPSNLGYLLHAYDFQTERWSSFYPLFRDTTFLPTQQTRQWRRRSALSPDGKVITVSDGYVIEVFEPTTGFSLDTRVERQPVGWPEDIYEDDARRRREDPFQPGYGVVDAAVDPEGRLWVVSVMPEENWEEDLREAPDQRFGKAFATSDRGMDGLVEVFDSTYKQVLASFRVDPYIRFIVGPGMLAFYVGDLPYPQFEVVQISLGKE